MSNSLGDQTDYVRTLLTGAWSEPTNRLPLLLGVAAVFLLLFWRPGQRGKEAQAKKEKNLPKQGGPWFFEWFRHEKSVKIAGRRIDIAWRHIGIVATSGARKSTLLAMLLERIGKSYVFVAGDHAPPLLNLTYARKGVVWKPRGEVAWYPWGGDLELAVQRVEHMFPASGNDAGVHRSMFKQAARIAWGRVDERSRDVSQVMAAFPEVVTGSSGKSMAENWTARLKELIDSLGDSLKLASDGGFDLCDLLRQNIDVGFALNSFADVSNRERFAKIAALEVLRAADTLGNMSVAFDEVGLLGAELFAESVRTLRVRLCTGMFASHISNDFPDILKGLLNVWFFGQVPCSDKKTREWMSTATFSRVPPEDFGEHALPLGKFYLVANGRVQKLTVPTWKVRPVPTVTTVTLPPQAPVRLTDTCVRWEGSHSPKGYGRVWISAVGDVPGHYEYVHILEWEKHNGPIPKGEDGKRIDDVDHECQTRDCYLIDHLKRKPKPEHGRITRLRATT